jgi:hypothetical protein
MGREGLDREGAGAFGEVRVTDGALDGVVVGVGARVVVGDPAERFEKPGRSGAIQH